jgi:TolA-binding protein
MRIVVLLILLSLLALPAPGQSSQPADKPLPDLFQVEKTGGQSLVSITAANRPLSTVLSRLAGGIQCRLVITAKLAEELKNMRPFVVLKKRPVAEVVEFLAGTANCQFRLSDKEIILFREPTRSERPKEIISGYKKLMVAGTADNDNKSWEDRISLGYFSLGTLFYLGGKYDLAAAEYQQILQQFPQHGFLAHTLLMLARSFIANGQPERARTTLSLFFNRFPKNEFVDAAFLMLADCYEKEQNRIQAMQVYQYLLRKPDSRYQANTASKLGQLYLQQERLRDALPMLEQAVSLLPSQSNDKAEAMYAYLHCNIALARHYEARPVFAQFYREFAQHSSLAKVLLLHATSLLQQGDNWGCYYVAMMMRKSGDAQLRTQFALLAHRAMMKTGSGGLAYAALDDASEVFAELEIKAPAMLYEVGLAYQQERQWQKARQTFWHLESRLGDIVYLRLLECDYAAGNYRECLQNFKNWQDKMTTPDVAGEASYVAGECWRALGEPDKAIALWQGKR